MKRAMLFFILLNLLSCNSVIYQVLEVSSENVELRNQHYIYDKAPIMIEYNFWEEYGVLSYVLFNNSDKPIFIDWKKSSYIVNNLKLDYWKDEVKSMSSGGYSQYIYRPYGSNNENFRLFSNGSYLSYSENEKPERITFIPPKSFIFKSSYIIFKNKIKNYNSCPKIDTVFNEDKFTYQECKYNKDNSILTFRNYITYSFDEKFNNESYIDNTFYISKVLIMNINQFQQKIFVDTVVTTSTRKEFKIKKRSYTNNYIAPNRFYLK